MQKYNFVDTRKKGESTTLWCKRVLFTLQLRAIFALFFAFPTMLNAGLKLQWCVYTHHKPLKCGKVMEHFKKN